MNNRMKCQNAAFRLQAEAYKHQNDNRSGRKPLRQFNPCPKGLIYSGELRLVESRPMSLIWNEVVLTPCECHPNFTTDNCIEYEHDTTHNPYLKVNRP